MNLVDSSGWLEYLSSGNQSAVFASVIQNTDELIISVINKYEVYKKLIHDTDEKKALETIAAMYNGRVIPVTDTIAMSAAEISINHHLPMADSILLATAQSEDAILWTMDAHFKDIPGVKYFPKE
jgi:predicted nucleic acid-binding protein